MLSNIRSSTALSRTITCSSLIMYSSPSLSPVTHGKGRYSHFPLRYPQVSTRHSVDHPWHATSTAPSYSRHETQVGVRFAGPDKLVHLIEAGEVVQRLGR